MTQEHTTDETATTTGGGTASDGVPCLMPGQPLLTVLDRLGCGGVILDTDGRILLFNPVAERLLCSDAGRVGVSVSRREGVRNGLKALLGAGRQRFRMDEETWAVIRRDGRRQLVLHSFQMDPRATAGPHTVVILIDLDRMPSLNPHTIQNIFALTPAETRLAVRVAAGETLASIVEDAGISMATARSQLASVFEKTRCKRQAELVALLAKVSILP